MDSAEARIVDLFGQVVPEIAHGDVAVRAIARKPGVLTKVAVESCKPGLDAIRACVGIGGDRVKSIMDGLGDERFEFVLWNDAPETLIQNALQPARIEQVALEEARHAAIVTVSEGQVRLVEGKDGVNRELAGRLSGWKIEVHVQ